MIEVFGQPGCYRWRWISEKGRVLFESRVCHPTDRSAHASAKALAGHFSENAQDVDRAE